MNENWFKLLEKYERGDFIEGVVIVLPMHPLEFFSI